MQRLLALKLRLQHVNRPKCVTVMPGFFTPTLHFLALCLLYLLIFSLLTRQLVKATNPMLKQLPDYLI